MRIKKSLSFFFAAAVSATAAFAPTAAKAIDWCEVLVCMAHPENYRMVPMCIGPVGEAFAYAKARQSWGECPEAKDVNNSYTEVSNWDIKRNRKGRITSINGTVSVYVDGKLHMQYPF